MGNLFASPSTQQIHSVATAASRGGGVFFSYGNYAGDVLNFDAAQDRLRTEGIACETVTVTDDIFSASPDEKHKRRGIAGDLTVFRVAAAAAEAGYDLEGVTRVAQPRERAHPLVRRRLHRLHAARRRASAVLGCRMVAWRSASASTASPASTKPTSRPRTAWQSCWSPGCSTRCPMASRSHGARVVPILNGLGSLKYEEMFVVYRRIAELLREAGIELVDPHVGEYCTSFDMAGTSLTLFWLDDELGRLWDTPVDTPAYRRGSVVAAAQSDAATDAVRDADVIPPSDEASRTVAATVTAAVETIAATIDAHVDELGRLDSIAGDGDHGIGMQRGSHAARDAAVAARDAGAGAQTVLARAADAWSDRAGGTSGALWGVILAALAAKLGDEGRPSAADVAAGVAAGAQGVMDYGKAEVGDKTLVDALVPFSGELTRLDRCRCEPRGGMGDSGRRGDASRGIHRRPSPAHGPRPSARGEEPRHAGPRRALARPHRHGRRRRLRKELTWHTPSRCAS